MQDGSTSAMIALLPMTTEWCKIDLPHLTLVYAGEVADLSAGAFNEMAKDASALAQIGTSIRLMSSGIDVFGGDTDPKVDVITFYPTQQLLAMRKFVERWNRSEFPFSPHATIGPAGTSNGMIPPALYFDQLYVGFGTDSLTFKFRN